MPPATPTGDASSEAAPVPRREDPGPIGDVHARRRTLLAVLACVSVFAITFGLTYPLLTLVLESRGVRADLIGLNAAMTPLGILLSWPWLPTWARRVGPKRFALACMVTTAALLLLFAAIDSLAAWFVLRLALGVVLNGTIVVSETWINQLAEDHVRGRTIATYTTVVAIGFGLGPLIIPLVGVEGHAAFAIGAGCVLAAAAMLARLDRASPDLGPEVEAFASLRVIARAPVLYACVASFGFFDAATLGLVPVYGIALGFDADASALLVVSLIMGSAIAQPAVGRLADRFSVRAVLMGCAVVTCAGSALLPLAGAGPGLWVLLFLIGGSSFGIYTASMVELGRRFKGMTLMAGSAAMAATYAIGAVAGPVATGTALEVAGPPGLPWTLAAAFAVLIAGAAVRARICAGR